MPWSDTKRAATQDVWPMLPGKDSDIKGYYYRVNCSEPPSSSSASPVLIDSSRNCDRFQDWLIEAGEDEDGGCTSNRP